MLVKQFGEVEAPIQNLTEAVVVLCCLFEFVAAESIRAQDLHSTPVWQWVAWLGPRTHQRQFEPDSMETAIKSASLCCV